MTNCSAVRQGDEMFCSRCGYRDDLDFHRCYRDRKILIGIAGPAGSGKSTVADHLTEHYGFQRLRFAGALKSMIRVILMESGVSYDTTTRMIQGDLKEVPTPLLNGHSPRHAMQTLGTEWGRNQLGDDFWTNIVKQQVKSSERDRIVIDDVRFENEAFLIRSLGGTVIRLAGRGGLIGDHISEQGVSPDMVYNNNGSVVDMIDWFTKTFDLS